MIVLDIFAHSLHPGKGRVTLVEMIDVGSDSKCPQGTHTTDTEENFLLETVLPVSSVKMMGHLTVFGKIGIKIGVEEIKVCPSDRHFPYSGIHLPARHIHIDGEPFSVFIQHRFGGSLEKILCIIFRNLIALRSDSLGEVTVPVEQADCRHIHIHIRRFLEVVSRQNTKPSRINLERTVQTVFHTEIGYRRILPLGLCRHISVEFSHHGRKTVQKRLI